MKQHTLKIKRIKESDEEKEYKCKRQKQRELKTIPFKGFNRLLNILHKQPRKTTSSRMGDIKIVDKKEGDSEIEFQFRIKRQINGR